MVRIDRIYTRTGDSGETSLGDGTRVRKTSHIIAATGSVDELNCQIGIARAHCDDVAICGLLESIQQKLFELGADLSCSAPRGEKPVPAHRITAADAAWLEERIDESTARLAPLDSFVLPGGSLPAASLHAARAVCRRAERDVLCLEEEDSVVVNPSVAVFLNRLSDLLFVLARRANNDGAQDVLWIPAQP